MLDYRHCISPTGHPPLSVTGQGASAFQRIPVGLPPLSAVASSRRNIPAICRRTTAATCRWSTAAVYHPSGINYRRIGSVLPATVCSRTRRRPMLSIESQHTFL
ncbi:unnamed protein product [Allacma fusca]|uniref:Uncharacterized protein n=1 Tax=Allacma fusca TaxID=39272 RepID=A0A8J2JHF3_9HEXA|nr:unnamed protein product [Allacma fusca]